MKTPEPMVFDSSALSPEIIAEVKKLTAKFRKPNVSPRGPQSIPRPLTGRALRRAQGETNRDTEVKLVDAYLFNGKVLSYIPSMRAVKRVSGGRTRG